MNFQQTHLIFDFDGVIINSEPFHLQAKQIVLANLKIQLDEKEYYQRFVGLPDKLIFRLILEEHQINHSDEKIQHLIAEKVNIYQRLIEADHTLPITTGLESFFSFAQQHFKKMAICTGSKFSEANAALLQLKQKNLFTNLAVLVTVDDVTNSKPDPEGYLLTAKKLGAPTKDCLVIEDTPHGIAAAKSAGMHVIALTTTFPRNKLQQADLVTQDFNTLLHLFH